MCTCAEGIQHRGRVVELIGAASTKPVDRRHWGPASRAQRWITISGGWPRNKQGYGPSGAMLLLGAGPL